jgi:formylglycine-generating enzyme required for sulfatase activity
MVREIDGKRCEVDPFQDHMLPIKGASFYMGDHFEEGFEFEKPVHQVTVPDFWLCKYLVTQSQWMQITGNNPSYFRGDDLPVEKISWDDTQIFLEILNRTTNKNYRLPSEAEWEYAAREGGKKVRFGNGKDIVDPKEINCCSGKTGKQIYSIVGKCRAKTTPVNQFEPNALGLHDMSGNLWEWVEDDWHHNYENAPIDGSAWINEGIRDINRVYRGGDWHSKPLYCRAAIRYGNTPDALGNDVGFRLAHSLPYQ